jgi:hypothetical protein
MRSRRVPILRNLTLALVGSLLTLTATAKADETSGDTKETSSGAEASSAPADAERTSVELRFVVFSPSLRWSVVEEREGIDAFHSRQSLYVGPGIGVRVFPKQPHHGVIVDAQYSVDTDVDTKFSDREGWRTDFIVARVGYGYRFVKHANEKMAWAFTPHGSFSAGASINRNRRESYATSAPVLGGRVGVNVDVHIRRFFMGWAFAYEGLAHLSLGPLKSSQFIAWTLIPAFRLGVDLGPSIQSLRH